jgi:hypothetical protein
MGKELMKDLGCWKKQFIIRSQTYALLICAFIIFLFFIWSNPHMQPIYDGDTASYMRVASDFSNDDSARDRPVGYPLIISVSKWCTVYWEKMIIIIQLSCLLIIIFIIFKLYKIYSISYYIAIPAIVIIAINPSTIIYTSYLVPEIFLGFFITLAWFLTIRINEQIIQNKVNFLYVFLLGICSGSALLMKPVWLLGILPLIGAICILNYRHLNKLVPLVVVLVGIHLMFWWSWQIFLYQKYHQINLSRIGTVNLNLLVIRMGLTKDGEGTSLYNFLKDNDLLNEALQISWDYPEKHHELKYKIPFEQITDNSFIKQIISKDNNKIRIITNQIYRWPAFIIKGPAFEQELFN